MEYDLWVVAFNLISFWAALLAVYFWLKVYNRARKGSLAWLLFALTSVFMVSVALFPHVILYLTPLDLASKYQFSIVLVLFWSAVYTSFFAGAGYILHKHLVAVPRENLGRFLLEGFVPVAQQAKAERKQIAATEANEVSNLLGSAALIKYSSKDRYEDAVIELALRYFGECRNVLLVSVPPRMHFYKEKLEDLVELGVLKIVNISMSRSEASLENGIVEIPATNLEQMFEIFASLPKGCAIIFEPLTRLIENLGSERIYALASNLVKTLPNDYAFIAFLNDAEADFKEAFPRCARVAAGRIEAQEGNIYFLAGDKFYM